MLAVVKVFGGVLVLGRIAATHVAAEQTHPQVNPGVADFDAVFTDVLVWVGEFDLIQMLAFC
jgi:hypothetical protein